MSRRPKLLPCPFCGNPPAWEESLLADAGGPYVSCPWFVRTGSGDLIGCEEHRYTPEGWNKRIPPITNFRRNTSALSMRDENNDHRLTFTSPYDDAQGMPKRFWRNVRFGPDDRPSADLNGCKVHANVCDLIQWPDGTEECMLCARDRQAETSLPNAAFHMLPYWDWRK